MSCKECEEIQNRAFNKNLPDVVPVVYVRVGNGNVAIVACRQHAKELIDAYKKGVGL